MNVSMRWSVMIVLGFTQASLAQDKAYLPTVAAASNEPDRARQLIRRPNDIDVTLFAAEPRLANPVAFTVDEKGRFYVVETFRLKAGVTDNRSHMQWLDDDLAARTVRDRELLTVKWLGKEAESYKVEQDRIRRIEDRDGDGKADHDNIYADGFHDLATGIAAGVLAHKGDMYFACIPDLWLLTDTKGQGRADGRKSLSTGYGVHVSFLGHDLHGLIMGPDGRLYFSIGDRGLHVVTKDGKVISDPDTGAILRCDLDGSNLEIFATGLRNPQELAFDNHGNLFTVDNNSDSGDKARVVQVVEGGDSGWRIGYQYIESPVSRGPWNAEKLWYPAPQNTGAYIVPPLINLSDGPSGLTFDPGVTLMPPRFKDHFFLADFRGGFAQSGIRSFALEPSGASFKVIDSQQPFWSVLATDVDFGPDGALYVSDWVEGWDKTGKGRIWRFADPARTGDKAVKEVQLRLAAGMTGQKVAVLAGWLDHPDRRIRQAAQFELADLAYAESLPCGPPATDEGALHRLVRMAESKRDTQRSRLHAIWALTQVGRRTHWLPRTIVGLSSDPDPEIRAQAARSLGDVKPTDNAEHAGVVGALVSLLEDPSPRVAFFAAQSLGKVGDHTAVGPLLALVKRNSDKDFYVRHAAVMGLAGIKDAPALAATRSDPSRSIRMAAVLALRRLGHDDLRLFLHDTDPQIVLEAARAIYDDAPRPGSAMSDLAALASSTGLDVPTLHRVVNANARLGGRAQAEALVAMSVRPQITSSIRVEALERLGDWEKPSGRDPLTGLWRPYPARPKNEAIEAVKARLKSLLSLSDESVLRAAIETMGKLGISEAVPHLVTVTGDTKSGSSLRVAALKALERIGDPRLAEAVGQAISSDNPSVRSEALRLLTNTDPKRAIPLLAAVLGKGTIQERQSALNVLAGLTMPDADALIVNHLRANDLPREVELDLLESADRRSSVATIQEALRARSQTVSPQDPLAAYQGVFYGGDAVKGRTIFETNNAVYCVRCHKVKGQGGEVGPDLTGIGGKQSREYLATSIVHPNQAIAQGFETVIVSLADGKVISGVFKSENDTTLNLMSVDNKPITVPKSEIEDRKRGPSAMPEDVVKKLKKSQLRDLVEYLSSLK